MLSFRITENTNMPSDAIACVLSRMQVRLKDFRMDRTRQIFRRKRSRYDWMAPNALLCPSRPHSGPDHLKAKNTDA